VFFEDPNTLLFNLTCCAIECLMDNVNYINNKARRTDATILMS